MRHRALTCICSNCARLLSWLDAVREENEKTADGSDEAKLHPKATPHTPPESLPASQPPPSRSLSPSKRRRLDDGGADAASDEVAASSHPPDSFDPNETPRPHRLQLALLQPDPSPSSLPQSPSRSSRSSAASLQSGPAFRRPAIPVRPKRSTSPIKRVDQLRTLMPPVNYVLLKNFETRLPEDVQELFKRIKKVVKYQSGFIPTAARDLILKKVPDAHEWPSHFFAPEEEDSQLWTPDSESEPETGTDIPAAFGRASKEFMILRRIERRAAEAHRMGRSESAWNTSVHAPLLDLAVRSRWCIAVEQITTAAIAPRWLPVRRGSGLDPGAAASSSAGSSSAAPSATDNGESTGVSAGGKMVDFAFVLALDDPPNNRRPDYGALEESVEAVVCNQPSGFETINQSVYGPLTRRPVGVIIETKSANDLKEGRIQLAVWTAAWYRRMRELCGDNRPRFVTLPLLLGGESSWDLFFACDRGDRVGIEILGPLRVGGTRELLDLYTLLAVLRALAVWMDGPFKLWMMDLLGVEQHEESQ
ncbi:hypothetical protein RB595_005131 [Gaeumannomyces hyphopodioides]